VIGGTHDSLGVLWDLHPGVKFCQWRNSSTQIPPIVQKNFRFAVIASKVQRTLRSCSGKLNSAWGSTVDGVRRQDTPEAPIKDPGYTPMLSDIMRIVLPAVVCPSAVHTPHTVCERTTLISSERVAWTAADGHTVRSIRTLGTGDTDTIIWPILPAVIGQSACRRHMRRRSVHRCNKSPAVAEIGDCSTTIDMCQNLGGCCAPFFLGGGELGPHLTQCGMGRRLSPNQVASSSIQSFCHNTPTSCYTDRQTTVRVSDSI